MRSLPTRATNRQVVPAGEGALPAIAVNSLRLADLKPTVSGPAPVRMVIPALAVDARIVSAGVEPDGAMEVPEDAGTVGWYRFGPSPGDPGSAVLVGHVDSRLQGPGVFFRLGELRVGALVRVQVANGEWKSFHVVWRALVPKERLPRPLFGREGHPILTLITCGGAFDAAAGRYSHNVVVAAVPRNWAPPAPLGEAG
jgi:sortase (surface protein transpeptidase)